MTVIDRWRGKQRGGESTQGFRDGRHMEKGVREGLVLSAIALCRSS